MLDATRGDAAAFEAAGGGGAGGAGDGLDAGADGGRGPAAGDCCAELRDFLAGAAAGMGGGGAACEIEIIDNQTRTYSNYELKNGIIW